MINSAELMRDILKFKGFKGASFKDKIKWLFVLYPFMLFVVALNWIDYIFSRGK